MIIDELIAVLGYDLKGQGNLDRFNAGMERAASLARAMSAAIQARWPAPAGRSAGCGSARHRRASAARARTTAGRRHAASRADSARPAPAAAGPRPPAAATATPSTHTRTSRPMRSVTARSTLADPSKTTMGEPQSSPPRSSTGQGQPQTSERTIRSSHAGSATRSPGSRMCTSRRSPTRPTEQ